ncbi:MAG: hypothetical protein V4647_08945 [Pseudomonadota bacterium]
MPVSLQQERTQFMKHPFKPRSGKLLSGVMLVSTLVALCGPAQAQTVAEVFGSKPDAASSAADANSISVTSAQAAEEIAEQQRLNAEQAAFAARQVAENEAGRLAYEQELSEREAIIARQQAEAQAAQQAYQAEVARRQAAYDAAMASWRADVSACQAGEFSRCAPAAPK